MVTCDRKRDSEKKGLPCVCKKKRFIQHLLYIRALVLSPTTVLVLEFRAYPHGLIQYISKTPFHRDLDKESVCLAV